jgi:hypothetical protein
MPKGGRRPNSGCKWMHHQEPGKGGRKPGRKPGSGNKLKSAEIIAREFEAGIMPLELLLHEMRRLYRIGDDESLREARMLAQASAPYCHPRLAAVMQETTMRSGDTLAQLLELIDGTTTGIADGEIGEPQLAIEPPVSLPN